jgi:thioredoxin reductase
VKSRSGLWRATAFKERSIVSHDVIVVGGSFAGLSAAMQIARARRRVLLIDLGLPRNRFAAASHGFLGQDGRSPAEIRAEARRQLALYPTVTFVDSEVVKAEGSLDNFVMSLSDGRQEAGRRLVLATGVRDELPPIPGLSDRWGRTVLHCPYCHGYELGEGRRLGILATGPHAPHQAALVSDWGRATLFTQSQFEPDGEQRALLDARSVEIERSPIIGVLGEAPALEAVQLADGRTVRIDALFTGPTIHMASPLAEQLGCAFDEGPMGPMIRVDAMKQTSVAGVFAAGDASNPMHNATLASASGVMAGVGAHASLIMATGRRT